MQTLGTTSRDVTSAAIALLLALQAVPAAQQIPLPKGQGPGLGRPTKPTDPMPLFDFDEYFIGKWTFDWDVPEGVFGPEGTITGTVSYTHLDGPFYEAITEATGPGGTFTVKETIAYDRERHSVSRFVTDSRGFSYLQLGPVGGDLGGYYSCYYDGAPFTYKGKTVRVKNSMRLFSPIQYQNITTVSVDGGRYLAYGQPWFKKDLTSLPARR